MLVTTDRDEVIDLAPANRTLGGEALLATVSGEAISPFDLGPMSSWPLVRNVSDLTGGAIDWGAGEGTCLPQPELVAAMRQRGAGTFQIDRPRGPRGPFTAIRLDTDTGATHADPTSLRLAEAAKLLSFDFDAMRVFDSAASPTSDETRALLNDWFSLLSRGVVVAATGSRSYVRDVETLGAVAGNGPFITLKARTASAEAAMGETLASVGSGFELVVDVQAPTWMALDRIEVYAPIADGDVSCAQSTDPKAHPKSRVACNGASNSNWPAEGIAASMAITAADVVLEKVGEKDGGVYQRARVSKAFSFPAPARDGWFVAAIYGAGTMRPVLGSTPFAITNPVFFDADGSGYDKPPAGKMGR
ncbi:MAG: hypothetical protein QM765_12235 [Myxococcales bacterium]